MQIPLQAKFRHVTSKAVNRKPDLIYSANREAKSDRENIVAFSLLFLQAGWPLYAWIY